MSNYALIAIIIGYLLFLFVVAFFAERNQRSKWVNNPYIYVLSLAVYCSAWTYYGSVGIASKSGISFLAIYLGPVIALPLWLVLVRKIIRISKQQKISSIADFISLRYGNNRFLGALVTVTCLMSVVPYIALQLKAVSETFELMTVDNAYVSQGVFDDSTLYISLIIAVFVVFFGTRTQDTTRHKKGIMATVALESVLKLVFFLGVGLYVVFYLYNGTSDIYEQAALAPNFKRLSSFGGVEDGFNWLFTICLSFFAIFLLPRQFHVAVVENESENHLKKAVWLFPLYLLLFNVFVIFIAWAGNSMLPDTVNHDYYSLLLPLSQGHVGISVMVFLGGFSAVISMIVVSTLSLSTMVSNTIIIPYGFIKKLVEGNQIENARRVKNIRRISIFILIIAAYLFYVKFSVQLSLYSIGLISFVVISQLAPAFFFGLFWRRGTAMAAKIGIIAGLFVVTYTLFSPVVAGAFFPENTLVSQGLFGWEWLRPSRLFGIDYLTPESNAFLWSMSLNLFLFVSVSVSSKGNYRERNYAEMFVNYENYQNLQEGAFIWKGEAYVADIRGLLNRFLGVQRTKRALDLFNRKYNISETLEKADPRLINFSEKLLTGSLGSVSAKILLSSVSKEKPISLVEVLHILEETKETKASNKLLLEKSNELAAMATKLRLANEELLSQDKQKDDFLDTVAHELKTPITAIKAAAEVLEDDDMPPALRKQFLDNIGRDTNRLATLIHNILDLEKLAGDRTELIITPKDIYTCIGNAVMGVAQIAKNKGVQIRFEPQKEPLLALFDEDRIMQVLTNLLSNSLKFTEPQEGVVSIQVVAQDRRICVAVVDNGKGIPIEEHRYIFEKFYQSKNQNIKKPQGSGFGLAICKRIIESHNGTIWADEAYTQGAKILFTIPKAT